MLPQAIADPERLAQRPAIDAAPDAVRELSLEQVGDPARELDYLDPACDFAARVGEYLAVLARDDSRQLIDVRIEQRFESEQDTRALQWRRF